MHPAGNCSNEVSRPNEVNREFCLVCGKFPSAPIVTVLGRVLCLSCMKTISEIDVSDENYPVIMEKLKEFWKPIQAEAEARCRKNQDKGEGYGHREDYEE